jgi:hypothetical protein
MSVRSGVFIKYVVEFVDAKLTVSNDTLVGDICIDGDVSVRMSRGVAGTAFEIKLYDLPEPKVQSLANTLQGNAKPRLNVKLGYFDTKVQPVLAGVYEALETSVGDDRLVTTVKGREAAFFACATTPYTSSLSGDISYADAAKSVLSTAALPPNCVNTAPQTNDLPSATLHNPVFRSKKVLGILDEIAERANAELLVIDGKVFLGSPIRYDNVAAAELDRSTNLASFQPFTREIPSADKLNFPDPVPAAQMTGFRFTVIGDPTMRPGQKIVIKNIKNYDSAANPEFRIRQAEHQFSSTTGYVCIGVATRRLADGALARDLDAAAERSAASAARDVNDRIRKQGFDNPVVEIASVKGASDPYQADLFYGQTATGEETQLSINSAVRQDKDHVYQSKPIASAFAWRKCGLVTPVYPGMKGLVVHNRAVASDGIVAGYIWSRQPDFAPPSNQSGDWWLCLPIDFDATQPPGDSTKAANDLTANNGCRIIELKGLNITVGAEGLKEIGNRPTPGDAEVCTIAHASGPLITLQKGQIDVQINADGTGPKLTMTSSGITLTDGTLNVQLANGKLAIG